MVAEVDGEAYVFSSWNPFLFLLFFFILFGDCSCCWRRGGAIVVEAAEFMAN